MKKVVLIVLSLFICVSIVAVVSVQFLAVAKNIDTEVYDIETVRLITHTIDEKDNINVSVSYTTEKIYDNVYLLSIIVTKENGADSVDAKTTSEYEINNMSMTFNLDRDFVVCKSYVGEGCHLSQDENNIVVITESEYISLDLIIIGSVFDEYNITVEYDIIGKGLNHLNRFENINLPLVLNENDPVSDNFSEIKADIDSRPDGKEVSIFKDNTFDCDYTGYKEIGYNFGDLRFSVKAPETWNSFRFYGEDEIYQNILIGFPLYNRPLDVKIVTSDDSTKFANDPLNKSTFFLAWTHGLGLEENLSSFTKFYGYQTKYDYETYVDKQGRSMKVYFLDGLPRLAVYDDFFDRCIVFNLENEDQIPIVVNMINSIEVSLSREAELTLKTAERLGYTIIPPKE